MSEPFDAIILGLGGMGSAAACHLAARGRRVLGIDQFHPPHDRGSSHGQSRVFRQAYYEHPAYVPLLLRAYELWRELEAATGRQLLTLTGGLMLGSPAAGVVAGSLRSAQQHGLLHELLAANEIRRRFPAFNPGPDTVGLYEQNAGVILPEESVQAHLALAAARGAILHFETEVTGWTCAAGHVRVRTARGEFEAGQLVICAGPWAGKLLADLRLPLRCERKVQGWFAPRDGVTPFLPDRFPVWIWETADGLHPYGLPALAGADGGVKVALHHGGDDFDCSPDTIDRRVGAAEIARLRRSVSALLPALDGPCNHAVTCLYTNTPDGHFLLDRHPDQPRVVIVSPCSGHGFKFCPVVGEIVADLVERGETRHAIGLFGRDRRLRY